MAVSRVGCCELSLACSSSQRNRRDSYYIVSADKLRAASAITPTESAARFWSMRPGKPSFTSATSPDPIGIAATRETATGGASHAVLECGWASPPTLTSVQPGSAITFSPETINQY